MAGATIPTESVHARAVEALKIIGGPCTKHAQGISHVHSGSHEFDALGFFAEADLDGSGSLGKDELAIVLHQYYKSERTSRPIKKVQQEVLW